MVVKLAGFNIDVENIAVLEESLVSGDNTLINETFRKLHWTPETISASYARISRNPNPISEIREAAREEIEKARKSNQNIIFDMGHSSIAEHAFFNIDIVGISRLLSEELEKGRLLSFTEKSQRYIKIGEDIFYPDSFKEDKDFFDRYVGLTKELFDTYLLMHKKLEKYFIDKYGIDETSKNYRDVINLAKEDARYILPLATLTQLGLSGNARSLEKLISKLRSLKLKEAKELGDKIYSEIVKYAPSLIRYVTPNRSDINYLENIDISSLKSRNNPSDKDVELIDYDRDGEIKIAAAILLKHSSLTYGETTTFASKMARNDLFNILKKSIADLNFYNPLPKEYENLYFGFNIGLSATAFAQLKRHRMATIIDGKYSTKLDIKIPQSIIETSQKELFLEKIAKINSLYREAKDKFGDEAKYILSNSHKKNVYMKLNFRELSHIARLRLDKHSQWDIREIAALMVDEIKKVYPELSLLLCSKEDFSENKQKFLNI